MADEVHDGQPRDAGEKLYAGEPEGEQDQGRAQEGSGPGEALADEAAKHTARGRLQRTGIEMQRGEPAARHQGQDQADGPQRHRAANCGGTAVVLERQPPAITDGNCKEVGGKPEKHEQDVRRPRAERADQVADLPRLAGVAEAGIRRIEARQRQQQHQRRCGQHPECSLAQATHHGRLELALLRLLQARRCCQPSNP